ncbi:hypothetical protein EBN03_26000 [Nocardia stercoris]|uniref:Uncharacterized protein n=1 Tax=Nocardia stercoris TaxID=2483361 RepID=A0A3M2L149_9NOCA|nr:hypothetical protein [Nocardia stercoris]RMI29525.1 hypothetical protein EBN03_26000 [Nocardia stercoris]
MADTHSAATGAVKDMNAVYSGYSYEQLLAAWGRMSAGHLADLDAACKVVATALDVAAEVITTMKIAVLSELAVQAATFASAMAATAVTDGMSLMIAQATRMAAQKLVTALEQALITYVATEVIDKAIAPLEHVVANMVNNALHHAAGELLGEPSPDLPLRIEPDEVLRYAGLLDQYADDILRHANQFATDAGALDFQTHGGADLPLPDEPGPAPHRPLPDVPGTTPDRTLPPSGATPDPLPSVDPAPTTDTGTPTANTVSARTGTPWGGIPSADPQHAGTPAATNSPWSGTNGSTPDHQPAQSVPGPTPGAHAPVVPQVTAPAHLAATAPDLTSANQHAATENPSATTPNSTGTAATTTDLNQHAAAPVAPRSETTGTPAHPAHSTPENHADSATGADPAVRAASDGPTPNSGTPWDHNSATGTGTTTGSTAPQQDPESPSTPRPPRTIPGRSGRRRTNPWRKAARPRRPEVTPTAGGTAATPWSRPAPTTAPPARVSVTPTAEPGPRIAAQTTDGTPPDTVDPATGSPTTLDTESTATQTVPPGAAATPPPNPPRVQVPAELLRPADAPQPATVFDSAAEPTATQEIPPGRTTPRRNPPRVQAPAERMRPADAARPDAGPPD